MGSQEKCTTWVQNVRKKVGTLCSGIDNIISQESLQYAENQFLTAGSNVKQFTENQLSTAGANVKQFTENQLSTAGANVKQFCTEFMQEVLPEFLKDSLLEKTQSEDTEKCDILSCVILKKNESEGHEDELSKSNACDGISASGLSTVGKEMSLKQNHVKVTLIPSDFPQVEASEKNDVGITPSICEVDQSHDGGIEDQIDLQSLKSVLCHLCHSSAKQGGTAEPEDSKVVSLALHNYAIVSAGFDEFKILENEVPSSAIAFSKALNDSTGDDDCLMLSSNKTCFAPDLQVEDPTLQAMDNFPLKVKFDKGWEFIHTAGYEDHCVESDQPRGKSLMQPREPKFNGNDEFCESDWEIV